MVLAAKNKINILLLIKIYFRSFLIQSSWNFEKMQNLGFIYSIMPALRKIYSNKSDELKSAVKRHLLFFNTHPYLSAPILGATIKLEEEYGETGNNPEYINFFKNSLMGICGGAGDAFFWGTARPFAAVIGVILALIFHDNFYAPLGCFVIYNIMHLSFRTATFFLGYYKGALITNTLKDIDLRGKTEKLKQIQVIILGVLLALIKNKFAIYNSSTLFYNALNYIIFIFVFFLLYLWIKKKFNPILLIYITAFIIIMINYFSEGVVWNYLAFLK